MAVIAMRFEGGFPAVGGPWHKPIPMQDEWVAIYSTHDLLDGRSYAVIAAVATDNDNAVSCALWRIVDDPIIKTCTSTVAIVTIAPDANGTYAVTGVTVCF